MEILFSPWKWKRVHLTTVAIVKAHTTFMSSGKHIGKVIVKVRDEESISNSRPSLILKNAIPRYYCYEDRSYVICGGLGGFGLELIDWLVLRGARNVVVTSRKGISSGYQAMKIRLWRSYGVNISICKNNMATEKHVRELLEIANSMGPVAAIFNLATVLRDGLFENQNEETFSEALNPKARATFYLDKVSRQICPQLEQFVVFSSVVCGYGNVGQTNYGMANSIIERICESRRAVRLPGLAIQWGAIGDVGLAADMAEDNKEIIIGGTIPQSIRSCLEVLDSFLKQPNPVVSCMVIAGKRSVNTTASTLNEIVANVLGITNLETVSLHSPLTDLGLDSMMTTEIKQIMDRDFEIFLTPREIRHITFHKLREIEIALGKNRDIDKNNLLKTDVDHELEYGFGEQYFKQLTENEVLASDPIVRMPSLAVNSFAEEVSPRIYRTIFIVPGVEGIAKLMEPLGMNLDAQVYCLQYGTDNFTDNVEEIAENLHVHILDHLAADQEFCIVGYSYGGLIALEMVKLLEKQNRSGQLWLIDSSPEFLKTVASSAILSDTVKTDDELQVNVITRFLENIWPEATNVLKAELYKQSDWDSRLDLAISRIPPEITINAPHLKALITARYFRVKSIPKYQEPAEKSLTTSTTLIRPKKSLIKTNFSTDYKLSQYFKLPVKVHFVEGDHVTMLKNKATAELIIKKSTSK